MIAERALLLIGDRPRQSASKVLLLRFPKISFPRSDGASPALRIDTSCHP
jgi:hypothetical protein